MLAPTPGKPEVDGRQCMLAPTPGKPGVDGRWCMLGPNPGKPGVDAVDSKLGLRACSLAFIRIWIIKKQE